MKHNYYVCVENLTNELSNLIPDTKTQYRSQLATKLVNPSTSGKTYWSILKTFANGRKVPVIPLLLINNEFVSNFKTKTIFLFYINNIFKNRHKTQKMTITRYNKNFAYLEETKNRTKNEMKIKECKEDKSSKLRN